MDYMNAIDLFAGAGGLSVALRDTGFDIVLANEINPTFVLKQRKSLAHRKPRQGKRARLYPASSLF